MADDGIAMDDDAYLHRRAQAEFELARRATHPAAASAHRRLAEAYLARLTAKRLPVRES